MPTKFFAKRIIKMTNFRYVSLTKTNLLYHDSYSDRSCLPGAKARSLILVNDSGESESVAVGTCNARSCFTRQARKAVALSSHCDCESHRQTEIRCRIQYLPQSAQNPENRPVPTEPATRFAFFRAAQFPRLLFAALSPKRFIALINFIAGKGFDRRDPGAPP